MRRRAIQRAIYGRHPVRISAISSTMNSKEHERSTRWLVVIAILALNYQPPALPHPPKPHGHFLGHTSTGGPPCLVRQAAQKTRAAVRAADPAALFVGEHRLDARIEERGRTRVELAKKRRSAERSAEARREAPKRGEKRRSVEKRRRGNGSHGRGRITVRTSPRGRPQ